MYRFLCRKPVYAICHADIGGDHNGIVHTECLKATKTKFSRSTSLITWQMGFIVLTTLKTFQSFLKITPRFRVLLDKLIVAQRVKK
jgi:hypothetical protein